MRKKDVEKRVFDFLKESFPNGLRPARRDGVLVLTDEPDEKIGLIIVQSDPMPFYKATIFSIGPDVKEVKPGDRVLLGKYYGTKIDVPLDSKCILKLVSENQIDAILDGEDD